MTMTSAMIKAIRLFDGLGKGEIRTVAPWEFTSNGKKAEYVLFHIEYCEEFGGEYKELDIRVYENSGAWYEDENGIVINCPFTKKNIKKEA